MPAADLWEYDTRDIARGFRQAEDRWVCLICGEEFTEGYIYEIGGKRCEAFRAVAEHQVSEHGSVFLHLLDAHQKFAGLTQHQAAILRLMHEGLSDKEIAEKLSGTDNTASIRNLRFQLKEREKQAKAYLALMEAFKMERVQKGGKGKERTCIHTGTALADERFGFTEEERAAVLKNYFQADGSLREFPVREKRKVIVLSEIAGRFEPERSYTEKEVNALIGYPDFATIRRYLIEYGFLDRSQDCSWYRVKERKYDTD